MSSAGSALKTVVVGARSELRVSYFWHDLSVFLSYLRLSVCVFVCITCACAAAKTVLVGARSKLRVSYFWHDNFVCEIVCVEGGYMG